ncbi:MAG: peptide deformylase [Planctomycetes bacterium]|nr:peptide deformylase [Planctomycetota bacterium]
MNVDPSRLSIVSYPAPVLKQKARPLEAVDDEVRAVALRMIELMHDAEGVGLAGPQVGLPWRLFVTNGRDADPEDRVYVNPRLELERGDLESGEEGCLSLPGITVQVRRPLAATITALDIDGRTFTRSAEGMLARIWQHEYDHLDGVLILDRMSPMDRLANRKPIKELEAAARLVDDAPMSTRGLRG